jgi:hypothetical protein
LNLPLRLLLKREICAFFGTLPHCLGKGCMLAAK